MRDRGIIWVSYLAGFVSCLLALAMWARLGKRVKVFSAAVFVVLIAPLAGVWLLWFLAMEWKV